MGKASKALYYALHPDELRHIVQWWVWHEPIHRREPEKESETLKECFKYLDATSRSFSAVIQELHPELLVPVALFYLILRGLDTIEDDMTIALSEKEPLLRDFENLLYKDGWTYDGNGPNEKDRDLLVHFDCVVAEFQKIKPEYQKIIKDITKKMGDGMADYANNAEHNVNGVNTIKDYELYCHYVAGLVGEGLTRLFVEAKMGNPGLLERSQLHESMGQFLQQTNIIRDIREDMEDKRRFWPKEVWSKYVDKFEDLFKPENREQATFALNEMVLIALQRADDCLFYLAGLKDQSVFNFCAIPQSMAVATIELCFNNPAVFDRNVKITKGVACGLMWESTQNLRLVCDVFKRYARKIQKKNNPRDPNFLKISVACGKIEQFIETIFPTQRPDSKTVDPNTGKAMTKEQAEQAASESKEAYWNMLFAVLAIVGMLVLMGIIMLIAAKLMGARFDIAWDQIKQGKFGAPELSSEQAQAIRDGYDAAKISAKARPEL